MTKTISFRGVLGLSFAMLFSPAIMANEDLTPAEINTIVKEDIASAQIMAEMCPATIGKNSKFDANIKTLVQSYLADYADKSMTYEKIQSDSEYKLLLDEARQVAKETPKDEQQSVCNDVLNYQA